MERRSLGCRPDRQGERGAVAHAPRPAAPEWTGFPRGSVLVVDSVFREDRDRAWELRGGQDQGWTELPTVWAVAEKVSISPGLGRVDIADELSQSCSGTDGNRLGPNLNWLQRGLGESDPK